MAARDSILTACSNIWDNAGKILFCLPKKYPFIHEPAAIKGRQRLNIFKGAAPRMSLIKYSAAKFALKYIRILIVMLNERLMPRAALSIVIEFETEFSFVCSAVSFDTVVVMPEAVME